MSRAAIVVSCGLAVILSSCARLSTPDSGAVCDAPRDVCAAGFLHGVCGPEEGELVLACGAGGGCRWWQGGCPVGWQPSDCPPTNPCCHTTADGPWPFEEAPADGVPIDTLYDLAAMGGEPVTRGSPSISVSVDPSVTEHSPVIFTCSTGNPLELCEETFSIWARGGPREHTTLLRFTTDALFGERVWLELLDVDAQLVARAFVRRYTDAFVGGLPARCPDDRRVFTGGSLVLNTRDIASEAPLHGRLDLTQADGHSLRIEF